MCTSRLRFSAFSGFLPGTHKQTHARPSARRLAQKHTEQRYVMHKMPPTFRLVNSILAPGVRAYGVSVYRARCLPSHIVCMCLGLSAMRWCTIVQFVRARLCRTREEEDHRGGGERDARQMTIWQRNRKSVACRRVLCTHNSICTFVGRGKSSCWLVIYWVNRLDLGIFEKSINMRRREWVRLSCYSAILSVLALWKRVDDKSL